MEATGNNNMEVLPPSYDESVRNRKMSTISHRKPSVIRNQETDFQEQKSNVKKIEKNVESQKILIEDVNAPKDPLLFVLIAVTLLGLVHQLPFSFFGPAIEYWMYKFRNTTSNSTNANDRTYLQTNFTSLSGLITTIPTVISNFLLTFVAHNVSARARVMTTLILHSVIFCVQVVFVNINTDTWQDDFFILTMTTMVLIMCTISFGAAGQYGLIPKLPPLYMKSYLLGGGMASLFNALVKLFSVAASPSAIGSANIYFGFGSILLLVTTIGTHMAINTSFFRYYTTSLEENKENKVRTASDIKNVIKDIWPMILLNVFLLAVPYGSVANLVVSENNGEKSNTWANQYFITMCSYVIPSITNVLGRVIYNKLDWHVKGWPMPVMILLVLIYQIITTVTIYLSNALPRHHLPVLLKHDWEFALASGSHGLMLGFITIMTNMKSIRMVPPEKTELAMLLLYFVNSVIQAIFSPLGMIAVKLI